MITDSFDNQSEAKINPILKEGAPACVGTVEDTLSEIKTDKYIVFGGCGCLNRENFRRNGMRRASGDVRFQKSGIIRVLYKRGSA